MSSKTKITKRQFSSLPLDLTTSKRIKTRSKSRKLTAEELELIPQVGGTCWFNVMLTVLLYSQRLRKVLIEEAYTWFDDLEELRANKFKRFLLYMLKYNYTNPEKIEQLFQGRIKPELLLLSFLDYYNITTIADFIRAQLNIDIKNLGYFAARFTYICRTFFSNKANIYDIYSFGGRTYLHKSDTLSTFLASNPKIIVLLNYKILDIAHIKYNTGNPTGSNFLDDFYLIDEVVSAREISDYEEEITVNGRRYKLDASFLDNYSKSSNLLNHVICGITYDNSNYVYNGWISENRNKLIQLASQYQYKKKTHCPLFSRDWKSDLRKDEYSAGFCLPNSHLEACSSLAVLNPSDLCYDFSGKSNNKLILVYVLIEEEPSQQPEQPEQPPELIQSLITVKKLVYKSASVSPLIKKFYNFESKTAEELQILLTKVYHSDIDILLDKLNSFKFFYFIITGERLTDEDITGNRSEVLRKIFMALLKVYVKDDKLFRLELLTDNKIKQYLLQEQIVDVAIRIGYDNQELQELLATNIINDRYIILNYIISKSYDKNFLDATLCYIFVFYLCMFYIQEGKKIELADFTDEFILAKLIGNPIENLKAFINFNDNQQSLNLLLLTMKIANQPLNTEEDFQLFVRSSANQSIIQMLVSGRSSLTLLNMKLRTMIDPSKLITLKALLIIIIVEQWSIKNLYNFLKPSIQATTGGSRKQKKKLRSYQ